MTTPSTLPTDKQTEENGGGEPPTIPAVVHRDDNVNGEAIAEASRQSASDRRTRSRGRRPPPAWFSSTRDR
jgi:hypothetical protein